MEQYLRVVRDILDRGYYRDNPHVDNPDEASYGLFEQQMRFDLSEGFPMLAARDLSKSWKGMVTELLWYLAGSTNVNWLQERGVRFWNQWATPETAGTFGYTGGEIGPIYGHQLRNFGATRLDDGTYADDGVDQIAELVEELRLAPNSKRLKVTTWNPKDVKHLWIAPCHGDIKCVVHDGVLDLSMTQRSADLPVGVPFNTVCYSLLLMMLAQVTGLRPGEFVHNLQDAHIYCNQVEAMKEMVERPPKPLARVEINPEVDNLFDFLAGDFELLDYDPHPAMNLPVAL